MPPPPPQLLTKYPIPSLVLPCSCDLPVHVYIKRVFDPILSYMLVAVSVFSSSLTLHTAQVIIMIVVIQSLRDSAVVQFSTELLWLESGSMELPDLTWKVTEKPKNFPFLSAEFPFSEHRISVSWAQYFHFLSAEFWVVCLEHHFYFYFWTHRISTFLAWNLHFLSAEFQFSKRGIGSGCSIIQFYSAITLRWLWKLYKLLVS